MAEYQEKYDWYMNEVASHGELTAEGRFNSISAQYNYVTPPPPQSWLEDSAYADYWANHYDDIHGPWPPEDQT
jgi:hypothetical protein